MVEIHDAMSSSVEAYVFYRDTYLPAAALAPYIEVAPPDYILMLEEQRRFPAELPAPWTVDFTFHAAKIALTIRLCKKIYPYIAVFYYLCAEKEPMSRLTCMAGGSFFLFNHHGIQTTPTYRPLAGALSEGGAQATYCQG